MAKGDKLPVVPATVHAIAATKASTDEALAASWVASLNSAHSRRNCERTAQRFLAELGVPLRQATVEDVRAALERITEGLAPTSARQIVLRVKSLLSYGHRLGYLPFNAGAVIKVQGDTRSIAQRIVSEVEIGLLVRAVRGARNRVLVQVAYAGGLRISELVALTWGHVIRRDDGKAQLNVLGKGSKPRQVLLPEVVSNALLKLRGAAGDCDPIFTNRAGGRLSNRAVNYMLKAAAERAGLPAAFSAHWLRHAHASHAIDHGAALPVVQATLGHGNIAVTSGYLHARPGESSGLHLDPGVFLR
jgi:integrase/recombinase XerD